MSEIPACCRWRRALPSPCANSLFLGILVCWTLNDLPGLPARKQRWSEVLRGMRFGSGTCLRKLRQSDFSDRQVLLELRPRHRCECADVLVFALDGTETADTPPPR